MALEKQQDLAQLSNEDRHISLNPNDDGNLFRLNGMRSEEMDMSEVSEATVLAELNEASDKDEYTEYAESFSQLFVDHEDFATPHAEDVVVTGASEYEFISAAESDFQAEEGLEDGRTDGFDPTGNTDEEVDASSLLAGAFNLQNDDQNLLPENDIGLDDEFEDAVDEAESLQSNATMSLNDSNTDSLQTDQSMLPENAGRYVAPGIGTALVMMGYKGLSGLGSMIGKGGNAISEAVNTYRFDRTEQQFHSSIAGLKGGLAAWKRDGLSAIEDPALSHEAKKKLAQDFFNEPGHKEQLDQMLMDINQVEKLSRKIAKQGLSAGMDEDWAVRHAVDPLKRLMESNKDLLESVDAAGVSLMDRMNNVVNSVLDAIKMIVERILSVVGLSQGNEKTASPRMG
ncbi:hypothetical protein [Pseudomonas sp.]|uniref:hypothetical protein n=1 Tax=Pseudomonas sp. TaxID=306 RepID=UPI0028AB6CF9|nr:hypothetical protein [Pseudomonas sp.]